LRKKTLATKDVDEKDVVENNEMDDNTAIEQEEHCHEKRERIFSSDVSIDNILDSSRRRLTKFSSQVFPPKYRNLTPESPINSYFKTSSINIKLQTGCTFPKSKYSSNSDSNNCKCDIR
jgi:hypothetical protein